MNASCMICLMAFHAIRCDKTVTASKQSQNALKTDTSVFLPYDFCKTFDCPAIDDPQCVRIRHYATGLSFYYIAVNKCEFRYLKCRDDVEGTIVLIKYCDHTTGQLAGKQTNETGKAHIRVKRRAHRARSSIKPHLREAVKEKSNTKVLPQKQLLRKQKRRRAQRDFAMISAESVNQSLVKVDMEQYEAACPTVCPSRDVMVCGICQHGIHRTFSSVCHMRMFGCNHTDEIMQLVSRRPCVVSSPFISEPGMQPHGRLTEPDDDDKVLRFIRCRDKNQQCPDNQKRKVYFRDDYTYIEELLSFYKLHEEKKTWNESKEICEEEGATLYFPENEKEHKEIISFWKQQKTNSEYWLWLGISRISNGSLLFETIDGRLLDNVYPKWNDGRPDNYGGDEDCVQLGIGVEGYNDIKCNSRFTFICKF